MSVMRRRMMLRQPYTRLEYIVLNGCPVKVPEVYVRYTDTVTMAVSQLGGYVLWWPDLPNGTRCAVVSARIEWFTPVGQDAVWLPDWNGGGMKHYRVRAGLVESLDTGESAAILNTPTGEEAGPVQLGINESRNVRFGAFAVERDGAPVLDLIAVADLNGTPCMFDRVTRRFFYGQGAGTVEAGPAMEE